MQAKPVEVTSPMTANPRRTWNMQLQAYRLRAFPCDEDSMALRRVGSAPSSAQIMYALT
jgi:hypothetical protein